MKEILDEFLDILNIKDSFYENFNMQNLCSIDDLLDNEEYQIISEAFSWASADPPPVPLSWDVINDKWKNFLEIEYDIVEKYDDEDEEW